MNLETATLSDGRRVRYDPVVIGEGAKKRAYLTEDKSSVICLYKENPKDDANMRRRRLDKILGSFNPTIGDKSASYWKELFCWPTGIVEKPSIGIICPAYPSNFKFQSGEECIKGKAKKGNWYWGPTASKLVPAEEKGTWLNFLRGCIIIARATGRMHMAGLAHSDLSFNNVLLDPVNGKAIIIDIDELVVRGLFPPMVLGTHGYIAPEVMSTAHLAIEDPKRKLPCISTDDHALPTLIYQYLLFRHPLIGPKVHSRDDPDLDDKLAMSSNALFIEHPTDSSNRSQDLKVPFTALGKTLSDLFLKSFVEGLHDPEKRPTAIQWESALLKTWDMVWPCENSACTHKSFVLSDFNNVRCPWCGKKPSGTIPVLNLRRETRPGHWMQDRQLAANPKAGLRIWHVYDNVQPGPDVDRTRQAYFAFHNGNWIMINEKLQSLTSAAGNLVAPGKAVALTDGAQIRLAKEEHGRTIEVKVIKP